MGKLSQMIIIIITIHCESGMLIQINVTNYVEEFCVYEKASLLIRYEKGALRRLDNFIYYYSTLSCQRTRLSLVK